jgi:predicted esterase
VHEARHASLALLTLAACQSRPSDPAPPSLVSARLVASSSATQRTPKEAGPIRMEVLDPNEAPPTFVMRGGPHGPARLVFLHGMCGHGLGYVQAFQSSAARRGRLIAPQGDVSCGGPFSKWSADVVALDARITRSFQALGDPEPAGEVTVLGMSQGASRAVALARKYPQRYTRLVSMAAPEALKIGDLRNLRGAVLMAGERDRRDLQRASERALKATGVPATFMLIPEATHGAMGPTPERTMGEALDWLWENSRPAP